MIFQFILCRWDENKDSFWDFAAFIGFGMLFTKWKCFFRQLLKAFYVNMSLDVLCPLFIYYPTVFPIDFTQSFCMAGENNAAKINIWYFTAIFFSIFISYIYVHRELILQSPMFCFKVIKLERGFFLYSVSKFVLKTIHGSLLTDIFQEFLFTVCKKYNPSSI